MFTTYGASERERHAACGFGFGDCVILEVLKEKNLIPKNITELSWVQDVVAVYLPLCSSLSSPFCYFLFVFVLFCFVLFCFVLFCFLIHSQTRPKHDGSSAGSDSKTKRLWPLRGPRFK